jgi:hypothetical protein
MPTSICCNGVRRGGGLRCLSSYGGVQLYICVCGMRKDGSDSRTQLVAERILARTKPLHMLILTFTEDGKKVTKFDEFVDLAYSKDFFAALENQ